MITVAELLRRASWTSADAAPPTPPRAADQVWVGALLRREGRDTEETIGVKVVEPKTSDPRGSVKKIAIAAGALLTAGALGVSAVVVSKSAVDEASASYPGQGLLDGLQPAQLGTSPLDAAANAAGSGSDLLGNLIPTLLPQVAGLLDSAFSAFNGVGGAAGLPFAIPGFPAAGTPGAGGGLPGGGGLPAGGGGGGGSAGGGLPAPAPTGAVGGVTGALGGTVASTTNTVTSVLPPPVAKPVKQVTNTVTGVTTTVGSTVDKVVAPAGSALSSITQPVGQTVNTVTSPVGSLLGGLTR